MNAHEGKVVHFETKNMFYNVIMSSSTFCFTCRGQADVCFLTKERNILVNNLVYTKLYAAISHHFRSTLRGINNDH